MKPSNHQTGLGIKIVCAVLSVAWLVILALNAYLSLTKGAPLVSSHFIFATLALVCTWLFAMDYMHEQK